MNPSVCTAALFSALYNTSAPPMFVASSSLWPEGGLRDGWLTMFNGGLVVLLALLSGFGSGMRPKNFAWIGRGV